MHPIEQRLQQKLSSMRTIRRFAIVMGLCGASLLIPKSIVGEHVRLAQQLVVLGMMAFTYFYLMKRKPEPSLQELVEQHERIER